MGRINRLIRAALCALCLCAACNKPSDAVSAAARKTERKTVAPTAPALFDARGNLLGTGAQVLWLEIPRGFTLHPPSSRPDIVYQSDRVPIARLRDYLAQRMLTGSAEALGQSEGVVYHGAMPPDGSASAIQLDIAVLPVSPAGSVQLRITPVSFPGRPPLPDNEARKVLSQTQREAE